MSLRLAALLLALAGSASAACRDITWESIDLTACEVDATRTELRLFLTDEAGHPFGQFGAIDKSLEQDGANLGFAMNAGMFHADRRPVGHYVEDGKQIMRVVPNAGPGNFGMLPNGVLCLREGRADVIETQRFLAEAPSCQHATQSGPMLVIDGALHPRFRENSTSRFVRNGVGTSADGTRAVFAISNQPVNFHSFARFFRDFLGLPQALYFDGNVSRLHAPGLGRSDAGFSLGPIVGTVVTKP